MPLRRGGVHTINLPGLDRLQLEGLTPEAFAKRAPFNITGCFFFQGMLELNHHGDCNRAAAFFGAAARAAGIVRAILKSSGSDDGEVGDLALQAVRHQQISLARAL